MPTLKRKHSDSPDFDSSGSGSDHDTSFHSQHYPPRNLPRHTPGSPQSKRRRFDLARNLSRLSLFEQARAQAQEHSRLQKDVIPPVEDVNISWQTTPLSGVLPQDTDGDVPILDVIRPIIEEPNSQANTVPEVRMHNTSSYEPEKDRIVITDLDDSEDETDTALTPNAADCPYSVSAAFLSRINASNMTTSFMPTPAEPTGALVLFRPSPWSAKDARELEGIYRARDEDRRNHDPIVTETKELDADAMEIE